MRENSRAISKLCVAAETCKRVLSTVGAAQCSVDSLFDGIDFNSTLSRSDSQLYANRLNACTITIISKPCHFIIQFHYYLVAIHICLVKFLKNWPGSYWNSLEQNA